jgi:hypothetical protein
MLGLRAQLLGSTRFGEERRGEERIANSQKEMMNLFQTLPEAYRSLAIAVAIGNG